MYKLQYDAYVRRHCHEKRVMRAPKFGTREYVELYGRTPPVNGGTLMQTLNRSRSIRVSDIEKEHGHYMTDKIRSALSHADQAPRRRRPVVEWLDESDDRGLFGSWWGDDIDPWGEFEDATGIPREQGELDYILNRLGHTREEVAPPDYTPVPQMEGVHSASGSSARSSVSDAGSTSAVAPFSPDSSSLYFLTTRGGSYAR